MRSIVFFALFTLAVADVEYYKTGNDHLDVDALLANRKELQAYLDCFEGKAPCTELTASYRRNIPQAIVSACRLCNPNQRYIFWKFLEGLKTLYPEEYWSFRHFYDPEDIYFGAFERAISQYVRPDMDFIL